MKHTMWPVNPQEARDKKPREKNHVTKENHVLTDLWFSGTGIPDQHDVDVTSETSSVFQNLLNPAQ
jgi:hypothetical protein